MMFPKVRRIIDKQGMKKVKEIDHCERCGSRNNLETAHVYGKGARGPDIKENCLKLCGPACCFAGCHGADHLGHISDDELFGIIAAREEKPLEVIKEIAHGAWRFGIYESS